MHKSNQQTYDAIFQHPVARQLHRRDVAAMLGEFAETSEETNGKLKVTRHGQTMVLEAGEGKSVVSMDELMMIRHFVARSEKPVVEGAESGSHMLVVLDHREARVYKTELHGAIPKQITPYDPHGFGRNLHYVQDDSNGQRKPERRSFYDAIAKMLSGASEILLFGSGTGASSAMEQLVGELQHHHPEIARRVAGTVSVDAGHLTENQLLAEAREFYTKRLASSGEKAVAGEAPVV